MQLSKTKRQIIGAIIGMMIAAALSALFGISSVARYEAKFGLDDQSSQPDTSPDRALV